MMVHYLENTTMLGILEKKNFFQKLLRRIKDKTQKNYLHSGGFEPAILVLPGHSLDHYANERLVGQCS